jgi:DNA repair protein RecO (recombination protein O)
VVRLMTPDDGLQAAYVRGARSRRMRPVLMAGNVVAVRLSARTDTQLPQAAVELVHSRAPLLSEPLPASAIEWVAALTATVLPEGQPYPRLYSALEGLLDAIEAAPSASGWGAALVRYEMLLLAELGFGLDLERCAVTGAEDNLVAVSPKSGRAVSGAEAEPYAGKLLPLPRFVREGGRASWAEIAQGLELSGHFLLRDVLSDRSWSIAEARGRLVDRLRRAGGLA